MKTRSKSTSKSKGRTFDFYPTIQIQAKDFLEAKIKLNAMIEQFNKKSLTAKYYQAKIL